MVAVYVRILYPSLFQFAEALWYDHFEFIYLLENSCYKVLNYLDGNVVLFKFVTVQST